MPLIEGVDIAEITRILNTAVPILNYITEHEEHQNGGVFCVANSYDGRPLASFIFGCLTPDECDEYRAYAEEKAVRLAENPLHYLSSQSRDMTTTPRRYGGAIRGRNFILSFSGFKEEQDEAAMLLLELRLIGGIENASNWLREAIEANIYFAKLQAGCEMSTDIMATPT